MYKETVNTVGKTLYVIIGCLGVALLLLSLIDVIIMYYDVPYKSIIQIGSIAVITFGVYMILSREVSDYEYFFIENDLIFIKKLAHRESAILKVSISDIDYIAPAKNPQAKSKNYGKTYSAQKSLSHKRMFIGYFNNEGKRCRFKFEPSDKLLDILYRHGVKIVRNENN